MKAKITEQGDITIVELIGKVDIEAADPFRDACLSQLTQRKLVFNLENLNFVGSNGITPFLDTFRELGRFNSNGLKLCRVSSEFRKIFAASSVQGLEIYETEAHAVTSYALSHLSVEERPETLRPINIHFSEEDIVIGDS